MAPALGVFLPKILFKVDLTWVENQGFPTGGGICSVLSSRGKIWKKEVGLNLPLSKNLTLEFQCY